MKPHRFDPVSLLFGIATLIVGIAAINGQLGNLINDRPDALVPLLVLCAGLVAVGVAARRGLGEQGDARLLQDVDGASDDQHDRAE